MAAKKGKLRRGKKKVGSKVSAVKLSNKRLNTLAKQGKLKDRVKKGQYLRFLKQRTQGHVDPEVAEEQRRLEREETEDIPLSEADYEYFATPDRDYSFITDISDSEGTEPSKKRRKKKGQSTDDLETRYEEIAQRKPRVAEVKSLLPIKTKAGLVQQSVEVQHESDDEGEDAEGHNETEQTENLQPSRPLPSLSTSQLLQLRQEKLRALRQHVATLASALVENPEENIRKLRELRELLDHQDPDVFLTAKKLALVSLTEVFKDIIPDYRIRVATTSEKSQAMKKETKQLRDYEESLLNNYKLFLEFLDVLVKSKAPKGNIHKKRRKKLTGALVPAEAVKAMRRLGLRCLCDLLSTHPHFNYRTNIIATVVPYMNTKDPEASDIVCNAMKRIFKDDRSGEVTLEVVRLIGRVTKACHFDVQPKMLMTLLSLKIKEVDRTPQDNKKARRENLSKMSRRDRKRKKQMQHLEKELEEAAAADTTQKRLRLNTEIINMIFLTYFRILKMGTTSGLLSTVLEGLAKFAHLINVEFFDDLFAVLTQLVDSGDLTYRESLHCVQTAFKILSGQGSALNIDPIRFYSHLYTSLLDVHAGSSSSDLPIALECLDLMINKRKRQISQHRLLAFTKRLTTLALHLSSNGSLALLAMARSFFLADPKMDLLFDTDTIGSGLFLPELEEPEHCNAVNTSLYELHMLRRSYHPTVRQYSSHLLHKAPSQGAGHLPVDLSRKSPSELYEEYDPFLMSFVPPVPSKPANKKVPRPSGYIQKEIQEAVNQVCSNDELFPDTILDKIDATQNRAGELKKKTSKRKQEHESNLRVKKLKQR